MSGFSSKQDQVAPFGPAYGAPKLSGDSVGLIDQGVTLFYSNSAQTVERAFDQRCSNSKTANLGHNREVVNQAAAPVVAAQDNSDKRSMREGEPRKSWIAPE